VRPLRGSAPPSIGLVALSVVLLLLSSSASLTGPYLVRIGIDRYITPGRLRGLGALTAIYLAILAAGFIFRYLQSYLMQLVGQRGRDDLRLALFAHLQRLSVRFYTHTPVGRLITRITNDIDALNEMITQGVVGIFGDLIMLVGILGVMLWMEWRLALISCTSPMPTLYGSSHVRLSSWAGPWTVGTRLARIN